jgi:7,8-dihydropterin-6-yl-methyl-4-(beta-D-ribofuranosyl)aminobenzene 5'-phosphate synthase
MDVEITLLSDNAVNKKGLLAEHGLSILLERDEQQLLFDVGQSISAVHNANVLGITFHSPPIVLSHGHYDHTGGLMPFVRISPRTVVFAHPAVFAQRFSFKEENNARDISAPFTREELKREGVEVHLYDDQYEVLEGIWTTGQIARPFATDQRVTGLSLDVAGKVIDNVLDEVAVVVEGPKKALLLLGCAHAGLRNTILQVEAMTEKPLYGIVGGMHLLNVSPRNIRTLALFLRERGVEFVAASHCTGCKAAEVMSKYVECTLTAVGTHLRFHL